MKDPDARSTLRSFTYLVAAVSVASPSLALAAKPATSSPKIAAQPVPHPDTAEPADDGSPVRSGEEPAVDASTTKEDPGANVETIVVVGSHSGRERTATETPAAIDVLDIGELAKSSGQLNVNQLLHYLAPSFNANRQSGADGADHIDPATLRGLGPDQTLVLVNGKRRHQSSLINIFGSRGRGNTGTDLNTIPIAAIDRIEILRDGASAMYGSDAIAGVINIVLKSNVNEFNGSINTGVRNAKPPAKYDVVGDERALDGETYQLSGNYGVPVGADGYINVTVDFQRRKKTNRAVNPEKWDVYRRQFGDASADNYSAFFNAEVPLLEASKFYAFGGYSARTSDAYAWTREPDDDRNVPEIYPNGFDPRIGSYVSDRSLSAGVKTQLESWNLDVSNTYGVNRFHYTVSNTLNASLLERSPTRFDAGGHELSQNTTGLQISRVFSGGPLDYIAVAVGSEYRVESYQIFAGDEGSYTNYGFVDSVSSDGSVVSTDTLGRAAGSQGFPGFQPANEVDELRTNLAAYLDAELDVTTDFIVGAAFRYERYNDFGGTYNAKLASRLEFVDLLGLGSLDNLALRASASTGFRAPSLAQKYHNTVFTDFEAGVAVDKVITRNDSPVTRALGIPKLKEEKSINASAGVMLNWGRFHATVDGYYVDVKDRIVLTGAFGNDDPDIGAELRALNVGAAQFFTNALDTETLGMDIIVDYLTNIGDHELGAAFAANLNKMRLGKVKTSDPLRGKEDIYFGPREQKFLLASAPSSKLCLSLDYGFRMLGFNVRLVRFDRVVLLDWADEKDQYDPVIVTDVSAAWEVTDNLSLVIGGHNILNVYPTAQDTETETGGVWDAVQMGFGGAFYFTKLSMRI